jgi:CPA2 family monovalent cation:H+ antiporter-2
VDNPQIALRTVSMVRYIFPELKVFARAHDDAHAQDLARAGADTVVPEMVATGHQLAGSIFEE